MQQFRAKNIYRFTEAWTIESNENRKTLEWDKIDKKKRNIRRMMKPRWQKQMKIIKH